MGIDPAIATFLLVFVPVVLIIVVAFVLIKFAESRISRAHRLIARSHRSSDGGSPEDESKTEHSDAATLVGSSHDVEKGKADNPRPGQEA